MSTTLRLTLLVTALVLLIMGLAIPVSAKRWAAIRRRGKSRMVRRFAIGFFGSALVAAALPLMVEGRQPLFPGDPSAQRQLVVDWLPVAALLVVASTLFGWLLALAFWWRNERRFTHAERPS